MDKNIEKDMHTWVRKIESTTAKLDRDLSVLSRFLYDINKKLDEQTAHTAELIKVIKEVANEWRIHLQE